MVRTRWESPLLPQLRHRGATDAGRLATTAIGAGCATGRACDASERPDSSRDECPSFVDSRARRPARSMSKPPTCATVVAVTGLRSTASNPTDWPP